MAACPQSSGQLEDPLGPVDLLQGVGPVLSNYCYITKSSWMVSESLSLFLYKIINYVIRLLNKQQHLHTGPVIYYGQGGYKMGKV